MARSSALKKRRRRAHWQILVHCPVSRRGGWQIRDCNPCIAGFRYSAWRRSHRVLPPGGSWWHHSIHSSFGWGTDSSRRRDSGSSLRGLVLDGFLVWDSGDRTKAPAFAQMRRESAGHGQGCHAPYGTSHTVAAELRQRSRSHFPIPARSAIGQPMVFGWRSIDAFASHIIY